MIERRGLPGRGVVTNIASLRESAGNVVGIGRALEVFQVARDARSGSQVVIVVGVAIGASTRRHRVRARQREVDTGMVKVRRGPARSSVACVASRGEAQCRMIGIVRSLVILHVTACARCVVQRVVSVNVTIGTTARRNGVQSGQRESR